jgi:hypothetical protein
MADAAAFDDGSTICLGRRVPSLQALISAAKAELEAQFCFARQKAGTSEAAGAASLGAPRSGLRCLSRLRELRCHAINGLHQPAGRDQTI